jgi:hypothetical protein
MFNDSALKALSDAGAKVKTVTKEPRGAARPDLIVDIEVGSQKARFAVEAKRRAPYPGEAMKLEPLRDTLSRWGTPLLQVPEVTEGQGRALTDLGWSWIDDLGNYDVRSEGLILRNRVPRPRGRGRRPSTPFPYGWAGLHVLRALITQPMDEVRTSTLSRVADVSAPRTSQVLHQLEAHEYISKSENGAWEVDRASLLELFLAEYPGPGGELRRFYALDLQAAVREIAEHRALDPVMSGDVAADLIAPHRRPSHLIAYIRHATIAEGGSLVATSSEADANVTVIRPFDTSVFPVTGTRASISGRNIPLAEATQIAWDLQRLGGADRLEQLEALKAWILRSH